MGGTEVIKTFLIGIGFAVDDSSFSEFNKALLSATLKVAAFTTGIQLAGAGVFKAVSGIAESFEELGYSTRLIAPAINKTLLLRKAMFEAYNKAGIDIVKVVQESVKFNYSLAKTKFALDALYKSVGAKFIPVLTKQMDIFRTKLYANLPKIQNQLQKMVGFLLKAFEGTAHLGATVWSILGRVWDFFAKLDQATNGWSTTILGLVAAWKLLNLSFLATPIGLLLTGLLGILALYDDFKTFQEGGESFFDWSKYLPAIAAFQKAVEALFDDIVSMVKNVAGAIGSLLTGDFTGFFNKILDLGGKALGLFGDLWKLIKNTVAELGGFAGIAGKVADTVTGIAQSIGKGLLNFSGSGSQTSPGNAPAPGLMNNMAQALGPQPLMNPRNAANTQNVNQNTSINIQGSADANSTGRAVASQQNQVNFNMTRNLRGASQ